VSRFKLELGAEPKKVAIAAGLLVVAGYLMYTNVIGGGSGAPAPAPVPAPPPSAAAPPPPAAAPAPANRRPAASVNTEFRPSLKPKRPEERVDPATINPELRLDLLARLQSVTLTGGERSLFDFGAAPPPKLPEPKILPKKAGAESAKPPEARPEEVKPAEPPKPPPPPIPLKFFGYTAAPQGVQKRAFFLQGEDIFVAGEGELIKARFKVVRIGINSAVVEDTQFKHQQTLPLELAPNV
jgi:hypothetical protein